MSFGLARGKKLITEGYGFDQTDLPAFDVDDPNGCRVDPRDWFAEPSRPFEIEIGSGKGTFLVQQGALQPEVNFLGIEWAAEFFRYAADRMRRRQLTNVKMLKTDATQFIKHWCHDSIANVIHLYFSDPWPKKRHHKRRVMQDTSMIEFHRLLRDGGELRIVTDHEDLWAWYVEHAQRHEALFERREFAAPESAGEGELVGTNYERKFAREGKPFHSMTLVKLD
ncbi:MAG: tRNA (guanosine(46)-N7)-methyltransferase TrmB [Planctomycetota bacterium]|nr:tRNA (guanosine(46)-N7)-methyltransferase TrmB [Planctomycetota bacterium]